MQRTQNSTILSQSICLLRNAHSVWIKLGNHVQRAVDFHNPLGIGMHQIHTGEKATLQACHQILKVYIDEGREWDALDARAGIWRDRKSRCYAQERESQEKPHLVRTQLMTARTKEEKRAENEQQADSERYDGTSRRPTFLSQQRNGHHNFALDNENRRHLRSGTKGRYLHDDGRDRLKKEG